MLWRMVETHIKDHNSNESLNNLQWRENLRNWLEREYFCKIFPLIIESISNEILLRMINKYINKKLTEHKTIVRLWVALKRKM